MADALGAARMRVARQVYHWRAAVVGLRNPDNFASAQAWESLERYLGLALRGHLTGAAEALGREADVLVAELRAAQTAPDVERLRRRILVFRRRYLQVETAPRVLRTSRQHADDALACRALARLRHARHQQHGGRAPPATARRPAGPDVRRQGPRRFDPAGRAPALGGRARLTRGRDQDHAPEPAAADGADPRVRQSGRAHRRLERRACGSARARVARVGRGRLGVVELGLRGGRGHIRLRPHRLRRGRGAPRRRLRRADSVQIPSGRPAPDRIHARAPRRRDVRSLLRRRTVGRAARRVDRRLPASGRGARGASPAREVGSAPAADRRESRTGRRAL
jgi:hypothetical protein